MLLKMIFGLLRINELISYCAEIIAFIKGVDTEGLQLESTISDLDSDHQKAVKAANTNRTNQYTKGLKLRDYRRDESFVAFRTLVEANLHRKDEDVVEAAKKLAGIIRSHGWSLHVLSRSVQSGKIDSLTTELNEAPNRDLINKLLANDWYQDMVDDNQDYLDLQKEKKVAESSEEDPKSVEIYRNLQESCEQLFEAIEVLYRITKNEKFVPIIGFINDCTQQYMSTAQARKTRRNNNHKEEDQESGE